MKKLLFLLPLIVMVVACGKRGPLIPPEALVPAAVSDLRVEQKGYRFLLCWTAPRKEVWGGPLQDLAGFQVFRRNVLPAGEDCETCPTAYRQIKTVDPEYLQDVRRSGDRYCFYDDDLEIDTTYQYKLLALDRDGTASRDSNKARRTRLMPPRAPELSLQASANGVTLLWNRPSVAAGSALEGYAVYRFREGESLPLAPLVRLPAESSRYEDLGMEYGVRYTYSVRTIAQRDGERVESVPSNEVVGQFSLSED